MNDTTPFVLTSDQQAAIRRMEAEKARLEKVIADAQRELAPITERLRAVAVLAGPPMEAAPSKSNGLFESPDTAGEAQNMTEAIEKIANETGTPIPRKELKRLLKKQGFPNDRLGNYFYTAVHRLKGKKRITVQPDGSVWRAPSKT
jgi:hypothetical protein